MDLSLNLHGKQCYSHFCYSCHQLNTSNDLSQILEYLFIYLLIISMVLVYYAAYLKHEF